MEEISLSEYQERQRQHPQPLPPRKKVAATPRVVYAALAVLVIIVSFYSGMAYQKGKTPTSTQAAASTQNGSSSRFSGMGGFGGGMRGDRAIGTVSSVSDSSITVTTRQGSSETYTITSSTTVTDNGQSASISDIQSGDTVFLTLSSSDSKTVARIELNPSFGPQGSSSSDSSPTDSDTGTSTSTI